MGAFAQMWRPQAARLARLGIAAAAAGALLVAPAAGLAAATPTPGALYRDGPSGRFLLGGRWYQRPDPSDRGVGQRFQRMKGLHGWSTTKVPSAANAGDFSTQSYLGTVQWYRKDFELPRGVRSTWVLRFESVSYRARVWLNGKPLGRHVGAYLPFELNARGIRRSGVNRLVVRVDGRRQRFDIPPLSVRQTGSFEGGWWNYTGILREIYLRRLNRLDFENVLFEPRIRCRRCAATIAVRARVRNVTRRSVYAAVSGRFAGRRLSFGVHSIRARRASTFKARVHLRNPRLWSPDRPRLYQGSLTLRAGGHAVQRYTVHTGVRDLRVSALGRIQLNFRDLDVRGASVHEDSPRRGAALSRGQIRSNVAYLRSLGARMTRSHYPLHPYMLELCDRRGILVWSEIPVFRMASRLFTVAEVRAKALRMLREEIARDQNHPSVTIWSVGNENASRPGTGLSTYIRDAARTAARLDPTRLSGLATSGFPTVEKQAAYHPLDVLGINDYFGWYDGPRGTTSDRAWLGEYLDRMHRDYPRKGLVITEFGAEANRGGPIAEKGTYDFQADFLRYHLGVFAPRPFISGALVWNLRDFRVKPGWAGGNPQPIPPLNAKGLVDDHGHRKPAFDVVRRIFRATGPFRQRRPATGR